MLAGRSHPDYVDYLMAEKFGLGWKRGESRRMMKFVEIMFWENERSSSQSKADEKKSQRKFR